MRFLRSPITRSLMITAPVMFLSGCMVAQGYSEQEQTIVDNLQPGLYQPASRQDRDAIETQGVLAQATFWSRESQLNPADLEAAIRLTAAVRKMGNAAKAVDISQTARAMHPSDPYLLAEYAASLIADERGVDAMKPLQQGLRSTPGYGRLWSLMGAALDQQEKYPQARRHYERALKVTPNDPNVLANMGLSFALEGNAQVAEQWLRRAAAQPGATEAVSQNLALVLQLQGKPAEGRFAEAQTSGAQNYGAQANGFARQNPPRGYSKPSTRPQPSQNYSQRQGYAQPQGNAQTYGSRPTSQGSSQGQLSNGQHFSIGKGTPKSASDAARLAARNSQGRKVSVPMGQPVPRYYPGSASQAPGAPNGAAQQPPYTQYSQQAQNPQQQNLLAGAPSNGQTPPYGAPPQYQQPQYQQPQPQLRPRGAARRR